MPLHRRLATALAAILVPALATALVVVGTVSLTAAPTQAVGSTEQVQRRLGDLGCRPGRTHESGRSGGSRTRTALIRFQAANGLPQTGRPTRATRARLAAPAPTRCNRRPVPRLSGQGRRVVVSQRQNYVWLVAADGRVLAQQGMVDNPRILRPGRYRAGSYCGRSARVLANRDYTLRYRLARFVRFAPCGVAFHQVPVDRSGAQEHGDHLLGTDLRTSHGCIRLSRDMSVRVWDFVTPGTLVAVVR